MQLKKKNLLFTSYFSVQCCSSYNSIDFHNPCSVVIYFFFTIHNMTGGASIKNSITVPYCSQNHWNDIAKGSDIFPIFLNLWTKILCISERNSLVKKYHWGINKTVLLSYIVTRSKWINYVKDLLCPKSCKKNLYHKILK